MGFSLRFAVVTTLCEVALGLLLALVLLPLIVERGFDRLPAAADDDLAGAAGRSGACCSNEFVGIVPQYLARSISTRTCSGPTGLPGR